CGAGEVLRQLQMSIDSKVVFFGYEISPYAFDLSKSRANDRLHFKLADITQEKEEEFDLILVLDVVEHLEDYFSFLRALISRSNYKIIHIPLDLSVQTILRKNALLKRRDLHAHIHYFTKETALQMLKDCGYVVLDYFYTPRSVELGSEPIRKFLAL